MKKMIKRIGAFCCAIALSTLFCLPTAAVNSGMKGHESNLLPDGIEYPMRRAVREGRQAVDDMIPNAEEGTVNDRTQGASDGVLDGSQNMSDTKTSENQGNATSENGNAGTNDQETGKEKGMTATAIVIACLAALAIIVLIFIAIPKSKSKPGGSQNRN